MKRSMISQKKHEHANVTSGTKGRSAGGEKAMFSNRNYFSDDVDISGANAPHHSGVSYKGVSTSSH